MVVNLSFYFVFSFLTSLTSYGAQWDSLETKLFRGIKENKRIEVASLLSQKKDPEFDINKPFSSSTPNEWTRKCPFEYALELKFVEILEELLISGVGLNVNNELGERALKWAIENDKLNLAFRLINKGVNPNIQSNDGDTTAIKAAEKDQPQLAQFIATLPSFEPNIQNKRGWTAVMKAARYNQAETAQLMATHSSFNPNIEDIEGWTAPMLAARYGQIETAILMINHQNFKPNKKTKTEFTLGMMPFYSEVKYEESKIIELLNLLKEKGEDFSFANKDGKTVLDLAKLKSKRLYLNLFPQIGYYLYKKQIKNFLSELESLVKIDSKIYSCDSDDISDHVVTIRGSEHLNTQCSICERVFLSPPVTEKVKVYAPKTCGCLICAECAEDYCHFAMEESGIALCPEHKIPVPLSFFSACGISKEERFAYHLRSLRNTLENMKGFKLCPTIGCINGAFVKDGEVKEFNCRFCEEKSVLVGAPTVNKMPDLDSNVRPCPFKNCHNLFTKDENCNHVTCPKCKGKWNFKFGLASGDENWNDQKGPRRYLVPGDIKPDGTVVSEYEQL